MAGGKELQTSRPHPCFVTMDPHPPNPQVRWLHHRVEFRLPAVFRSAGVLSAAAGSALRCTVGTSPLLFSEEKERVELSLSTVGKTRDFASYTIHRSPVSHSKSND
jgi:hypothetical protein